MKGKACRLRGSDLRHIGEAGKARGFQETAFSLTGVHKPVLEWAGHCARPPDNLGTPGFTDFFHKIVFKKFYLNNLF
jgi:hypothetical protein